MDHIARQLGDWKWEKIQNWGTEESKWYHFVVLAISGVCGVAIAWTSINAQQYVTATTMLLITNLNKVRCGQLSNDERMRAMCLPTTPLVLTL